MQYLKSLWKGDEELWKTFWVFGIGVTIAFSYVSDWLLTAFIRISPDFIVFLSFLMAALSMAYSIFIWVAIWRSSMNYEGIKLWSYSAKGIVSFTIAITIYAIYQLSTIDINDPDKNSSNIKDHLNYKEGYPYVGFWKGNCSENFGLAINKASDSLYSVSFCGPGGCFKPGTYRPNTALVGDPEYRIINKDSIEVNGNDGFSRYNRCGL